MKIKLILGGLMIAALVLAGCGADNSVSNVDAGTDYSAGDAGSAVQDTGPADVQGQMPTDGHPQPPAGGQGQGENGKPRLDLAGAAEILGISEEELRTALDNSSADPGQGPPDFEAAAEELGIPVEDLVNALGVPAGGGAPADGGAPAGGSPGS